jgi:hypothetical protein
MILQLKCFEIYVGVMETFFKKDLWGVQTKLAFQVEYIAPQVSIDNNLQALT